MICFAFFFLCGTIAEERRSREGRRESVREGGGREGKGGKEKKERMGSGIEGEGGGKGRLCVKCSCSGIVTPKWMALQKGLRKLRKNRKVVRSTNGAKNCK